MIRLQLSAGAPSDGTGDLFERFWQRVAAAPGPDHGLVALGAAILLLLICMVAFAAIAAVLRYRNRRKERAWQEREERWQKPLLDVLAGTISPAALWDLVEKGEDLFFVDYVLRFARRMRGSSRHVLEELARPYLGAVVIRLQGGDPERRARAVETVAMLGFGPFAGSILAALADPSPLVAMIAARSIARHQRPEHVPVVLTEANRLSNWSPRQVTAVLVSMGVEATPALREALVSTDLPTGVRAVCADALRQLHDAGALPAAADVLATATDRELLAATLRLLGDLGQVDQAAHIRPFAAHPDPVIRSVALQALSMTGDATDHETLRGGMADESGWVAIQAARALKQSGGSASLRALARGEDARAQLARQVLLESA